MAALSLRKELANRLCGALAPCGLPIWIPEQPRRASLCLRLSGPRVESRLSATITNARYR